LESEKRNFSCSLLVPCRNAEKYLASFCNSLLEYKNFYSEIILLDDGSTDRTYEIIKNWPVRIIKNDLSLGVGNARNILAREAKTDWIHFLDVDDQVLISTLLDLPSKIDSNASVILGNVDWVTASDRSLQIRREYQQKDFVDIPIRQAIINPIGIIGVIIKRKVFNEVGGFRIDINCWEDSDLLVRVASKNYKFQVLEKLVAYSLRHSEGISKDQSYCADCRFKLLKEYYKEFGQLAKVEIIQALSILANQYALEKNYKKLGLVIEFANSIGAKLPNSKNIYFNALLKILPKTMGYVIQHKLRS
jgi:glycosyltransferase involved in cell wall biosynthesis